LQQHFIFAATFIFKATLISIAAFNFAAQTIYICCNIFFLICSTLKAIAAGILIMQQVLFVRRKLFKIAVTFKFVAEIITICSNF